MRLFETASPQDLDFHVSMILAARIPSAPLQEAPAIHILRGVLDIARLLAAGKSVGNTTKTFLREVFDVDRGDVLGLLESCEGQNIPKSSACVFRIEAGLSRAVP